MGSWISLVLAAAAVIMAFLWRRERSARLDLARHARRQIQTLRESQEALHAGRDWREAATSATLDLLLVSDGEMHVRYVNPAARAVFGDPTPDSTLISYTHNLALEQLAADAVEVDDPMGLERVIDFDERLYRARGLAIAGGVGLALTDVSEVRRLSRARQDMVANLSHELRTPLTSLRLLVDTLLGPAGQEPGTARELVGKMAAEVDTLTQIAQEMLDLATIESGRQVVRLVPVRLAEVVAGPLDRLADMAQRREVRIANEISPDLQVLADKEQAGRAVLNVLHNAIKFTPGDGEVRLEAGAEPGQGRVVLSILDSGPGIPPDELDRIFERFFRGDRARGTPGTGLGLAIARHILRAHGGRIWAENRTPPDHGVIFYLAFHAV